MPKWIEKVDVRSKKSTEAYIRWRFFFFVLGPRLFDYYSIHHKLAHFSGPYTGVSRCLLRRRHDLATLDVDWRFKRVVE